MNTKKLVKKITFNRRITFYTPEDPFLIYFRLAKLFIRARTGVTKKVTMYKTVLPFKIFEKYENSYNLTGYGPYAPLHFVKWVLQEIPTPFWKFNVLVSLNRQELINSARESSQEEIWVDTVGIENKIKSVRITGGVMEGLQRGFLRLPSYVEIVGVVKTWQENYQYKWGNVGEQYVNYQ